MQVIQKIKQFLLHRSLISGSSDPGSGNRLRCSRNTYIKNQRNIRIIGSVSLVLLFALTAFTLRPVSVSTDFAEATANPATTTLTIAASGDAAILDITPSSTTGTFSSSDTTDTSLEFSVTTDNITGYNLSIRHASATSPAPLVNEALSLNLDSLETSVTESQFNTSTYVGRYGYKPSMLNSEDNSNYIPAPTTNSTTLNKTTRANTTSDNYTIALGANIDYTKSAGTYTNTFILTAVANDVPYTINYLDNTGTGGTTGTDVSNLPDPEASSTATASRFILSSTIPTRTGYDFAGWCYGTVTHNATGNDTCSSSSASGSTAAGDGQTYSAGSTFSFAGYSTSTNVANLYAMWNVKTFAITLDKTNATAIVIDGTSYTGSSATFTYGNHTISGTYPSGYEFSSWATSNSTNLAITSTTSASTTITVHGEATLTLTGKTSKIYMQDMTAIQCTTTAQTVYDKRDEQAYLVQKLADGKCWLLDNLRLGYADFASGVTTLDSTNTNTTKSIATGTFTGWNTTSGFSSYNIPMINTASVDVVPTPTYGTASNKVGVYYNYCAATMQSYCYASGSGAGDASEDVCPKGWRMPTGGSNGEYQALCNAVKGSACSSSDTSAGALKLREVLSTPLSGYFYDSSANSQGSYGYFWSSTNGSGDFMYSLLLNSSYVYPQYNYSRNAGVSVRCVLKGTQTIADATYMQDVTLEMQADTPVGTTATLIDKRDNQSYLVGKLADGKLWMLDNLRLGSADFASGVTTLDSTNTNTTKSITTSTFAGWNTTSGFSSFNTPMINTASADTPTTSYGSGSGKIGVYYNYCAATMQSYCMAHGSGSGNATQDVCPKGWRMPTGGSSGEYQALYTAYSSNATNFINALSTPLSGYFLNSSADYQGSNGYFWSSTYSDSYSMYYLHVFSSGVLPEVNTHRQYGYSVRCVLK